MNTLQKIGKKYIFNLLQKLKMNKLQNGEKKYVTFEDLEFVEKYPGLPAWNIGKREQARVDFENGWGVSVIRGNSWTDGHAFEIAVMRDGDLRYDTEVTDDVLQFDSIEDLNACLRDIQNLDENGIIRDSKEKERAKVKRHIEQRKAQIKKARALRCNIVKRHPEEKVSGGALADEIAHNVVSGKEKRTITLELGAEIRRRKALESSK